MARSWRGPRRGSGIPSVVYESRWDALEYRESKVHQFRRMNRANSTAAERELYVILNQLGNGALRGGFRFQHIISGKWIVDFFFPHIRLVIEVDGSIHNTPSQKRKDAAKDAGAIIYDITLIRIRNAEVFGNRSLLIKKLRDGWHQALLRQNSVIGSKPASIISVPQNQL